MTYNATGNASRLAHGDHYSGLDRPPRDRPPEDGDRYRSKPESIIMNKDLLHQFLLTGTFVSTTASRAFQQTDFLISERRVHSTIFSLSFMYKGSPLPLVGWLDSLTRLFHMTSGYLASPIYRQGFLPWIVEFFNFTLWTS
ncbi:hypothetical protein V6N13_101091 [Hibiscus sabdariffa]